MNPPCPNRGLSRLLLRWPARRDELIAASGRSSEFRELCELYDDAASALEGWRRSRNDVAADRAAEYEQLMLELEADIETLLARRKNR